MSDAISKLSPAAARLLLAYLSMAPGESYEEVVARSGIVAFQTVTKAKKNLCDAGFLFYDQHGREHLSFQRSDAR